MKLNLNQITIPVFDIEKSIQFYEILGLKLTIATKSGFVLFDTDPTVLYSNKLIADDPLFQKALASKTDTGATEFELQNHRWIGSYVNLGLDLVAMTKTEWKKSTVILMAAIG